MQCPNQDAHDYRPCHSGDGACHCGRDWHRTTPATVVGHLVTMTATAKVLSLCGLGEGGANPLHSKPSVSPMHKNMYKLNVVVHFRRPKGGFLPFLQIRYKIRYLHPADSSFPAQRSEGFARKLIDSPVLSSPRLFLSLPARSGDG